MEDQLDSEVVFREEEPEREEPIPPPLSQPAIWM